MHRWASDPRHEGEALPSGEEESQEAAPASKTLPNLEQPLQGAEPQHAGVAAPPFRPARQELAGWAAPSTQASSEASAPLVVASNYPLVEPSSGKRSMSIAAALALALCFGLAGFALGYVLFSDQREEVAAGSAAPPTPCVNTEPRVAMGAAPPPPPPLEETVEAEAKTLEAAVSASTTGGKKGPVASGAAAKAGTSGEGNELLSGLGNIPGPISGPAAGSGSSGAGLESSAIERTVQQYQSGVRRSCWQPALNNRALGAASSARVTATLRISPSGTVNSVSHSGDPSGYPGLANCIAARVKAWTFPKAAGPTTANIPFVFAAQ